MRLMLWINENGSTHSHALRTNGALSFLYVYHSHSVSFLRQLDCSNTCPRESPFGFRLSLLKALCRMGLTLDANTPPTYCYKQSSSNGQFSQTNIYSISFLEFLFDIFGINLFWLLHYGNREYYVSEWLSNGWICAQKGNWFVLSDFACYHSYDCDVRFRILRQLLALGLFREPESEQFWSAQCDGCQYKNPAALVIHRQCPLLIPLLNEFLRMPLSLLQLSRMEIRRLVGMNDFERRLRTLLLPPLLLEYVWRANEMLIEVVPQESKDSESQSI